MREPRFLCELLLANKKLWTSATQCTSSKWKCVKICEFCLSFSGVAGAIILIAVVATLWDGFFRKGWLAKRFGLSDMDSEPRNPDYVNIKPNSNGAVKNGFLSSRPVDLTKTVGKSTFWTSLLFGTSTILVFTKTTSPATVPFSFQTHARGRKRPSLDFRSIQTWGEFSQLRLQEVIFLPFISFASSVCAIFCWEKRISSERYSQRYGPQVYIYMRVLVVNFTCSCCILWKKERNRAYMCPPFQETSWAFW